jgi:hypothetical protein
VKKTKLGLREFIKLGAFQQTINTRSNTAVRAALVVSCGRALQHTLRHGPSLGVAAMRARFTRYVCVCRRRRRRRRRRHCLQLNVVHFRVAGFGLFSGTLTIKASYAVESARRVAIRFVESSLVRARACVWPAWCICSRAVVCERVSVGHGPCGRHPARGC